MTSGVFPQGIVVGPPVMSDPLSEILTIRQSDPAHALERLTREASEFCGRPEAKLLQAELVHQLQGPEAALRLLARLVSVFPRYGSAHHLLARAQGELGNESAKREGFLLVHALDAVLDDALEEHDAVELERAMTRTAVEALRAAPIWARARLASTPLLWSGRPSREQVVSGVDPRAHATLQEAGLDTASKEGSAARLQVTLYRTNLLASAEGDAELRANLRLAIERVLQRLA